MEILKVRYIEEKDILQLDICLNIESVTRFPTGLSVGLQYDRNDRDRLVGVEVMDFYERFESLEVPELPETFTVKGRIKKPRTLRGILEWYHERLESKAFDRLLMDMYHREEEGTLYNYADGTLPEAERERFERHLRKCKQCREDVEFHREVNRQLAEYSEADFLRDMVQGIQSLPKSSPIEL